MFRWLAAVVAVLLAGCQTIPLSVLNPKEEDGSSRVVIRPFQVHLGFNSIAVLLGGGSTPFRVGIYDVTQEPKYLGTLFSRGVMAGEVQDAFEYDVGPGRKILMLHMKKFGGSDYVDFVEFTVAPNQMEHIAISQYGMMDRPYFRKIDFDQKASKHCGYTKGLERSEAEQYFKSETIPDTNKYAVRYCVAISSRSVVKRVPSAESPALLTTAQAQALKDKLLPLWRKLGGKEPPYDIE